MSLFTLFNPIDRSKARGARLAKKWALLSIEISRLDAVARAEFDHLLDALGGWVADEDAQETQPAPRPRFDRN